MDTDSDNPVRSAQNRMRAFKRWAGADSAEYREAVQEWHVARLERQIAAAPPLSASRVDRLVGLLRPQSRSLIDDD